MIGTAVEYTLCVLGREFQFAHDMFNKLGALKTCVSRLYLTVAITRRSRGVRKWAVVIRTILQSVRSDKPQDVRL